MAAQDIQAEDAALRAAVAESQEYAWRKRLIEYLLPRMVGDEGEKEVTLEMVMASVAEAKQEGLLDAADILQRMKDSTPYPDRKLVLGIAEKAIRTLKRLNEENP